MIWSWVISVVIDFPLLLFFLILTSSIVCKEQTNKQQSRYIPYIYFIYIKAYRWHQEKRNENTRLLSKWFLEWVSFKCRLSFDSDLESENICFVVQIKFQFNIIQNPEQFINRRVPTSTSAPKGSPCSSTECCHRHHLRSLTSLLNLQVFEILVADSSHEFHPRRLAD